jgi:uncharacterized protein YcbX
MARIQELWRYPIKSLAGERVDELALDADGVHGDRRYGILDLATDRVLTGRREPRLLHAAAALEADGTPRVTLPDGAVLAGPGPATDAGLSGWLGRPVTLVAAAERPPSRAEFFKDATDDASTPLEWTMPPGRFVDAAPVLVVTTAALRAGAAAYPAGDWDPRRFRANVLVEVDGEGWVEDGWCGATVSLGAATVAPRKPCVRCTMVTRAQPGLAKDVNVYKTLARVHGSTFGVWAWVERAQVVRVGDPVVVGASPAPI